MKRVLPRAVGVAAEEGAAAGVVAQEEEGGVERGEEVMEGGGRAIGDREGVIRRRRWGGWRSRPLARRGAQLGM